MTGTRRRLSFAERRAVGDAAHIPPPDLLAVAGNVIEITIARAGLPGFRQVNRCAVAIAIHCLERARALDRL